MKRMCGSAYTLALVFSFVFSDLAIVIYIPTPVCSTLYYVVQLWYTDFLDVETTVMQEVVIKVKTPYAFLVEN